MSHNNFPSCNYQHYPRGYGRATGYPRARGQTRGSFGYGTYQNQQNQHGYGRGVQWRGRPYRGQGNNFNQRYPSNYTTYQGQGTSWVPGGTSGFSNREQQRGLRPYRGQGNNFNQRYPSNYTTNQGQGTSWVPGGTSGFSNREQQRGLRPYRGQGNNFNQRYPSNCTTNQGQGTSWVPGGTSGFSNREQHRDSEGTEGSWRTRSSNNSRIHHNQRGSLNQNRRQGVVQKTQQQTKVSEQFLDFPFLVKADVVDLMTEFKVMFILRGLPGSGKTTVAQALLQKYQEHAVVCSADHYRYNKHGDYVWSVDSLQETHNKCQRKAQESCELNKPVVIIDNTNVAPEDMQPYFNMAKKNGYIVVLTEPKTPWKLNPRELSKKNTHKVSFTYLSRKAEQFDDILPLYFGWFVSLKSCLHLRKCAEAILQSCLELEEFKGWMARLSGCSDSKYTADSALSMYSITKTDSHPDLHVTACYSPRGKYLDGSPYVKSRQVQDSVGNISWITIIGWVLTQNTISARVVLTKQQQKLWKNEDKQTNCRTPVPNTTAQNPVKASLPAFGRCHMPVRGYQLKNKYTSDEHTLKLLENLKVKEESHLEDSVTGAPDKEVVQTEGVENEVAECVENSFEKTPGSQDVSKHTSGMSDIHLKPNYGLGATSHITLGTATEATPVQAKHDIQRIINHEVGCHSYKRYVLNDGVMRQYDEGEWVVYLNNAVKVLGIFSGCYG